MVRVGRTVSYYLCHPCSNPKLHSEGSDYRTTHTQNQVAPANFVIRPASVALGSRLALVYMTMPRFAHMGLNSWNWRTQDQHIKAGAFLYIKTNNLKKKSRKQSDL
jgi:hypothetical protein